MRAVLVPLLLSLTAPAFGADPETDTTRAQAVVRARCARCHGVYGQSVSIHFPKLAGQHAEYIVRQLFGFKTGERPSSVMKKIANDLSASDMTMLAQYFSEQPPATAAEIVDPELAVIGRYTYFKGNRWNSVSACADCHGVYASGGAQMPRLAGQHPGYIEARLLAGKLPGRRDQLAAMHSSVAAISTLEIKAVAQYLSGQE